MDDSSFLGHFWRLGSGDPLVRGPAISGILRSLRATSCRASDSAVSGEAITAADLEEPKGNKKKEEWKGKDFQFKLSKSESSYPLEFLNALEYSTNRLVHGLSSGREAVRQGYAAALTAVLLEFPNVVPLSAVCYP